MKKPFHGVKDQTRGKDVSDTIAESRTTWALLFDYATGANTPFLTRCFGLFLFIMGTLTKQVFLQLFGLGIILFFLPFAPFSKRNQQALHHIPKHLSKVIRKDPLTDKAPEGEIYCGTDRFDKRQLWLSHREDNMHTSVFGGTGSGKTEYFVSLDWHYLTCGSGVFNTDPKGDVKFPHQVYFMARMLGREQDLTLVSYNTKDSVAEDGFPAPRQTNRLNLINGDWGTEKEILISLMAESEGSNASFIDNAKILIEVHLRALSMLRDRGYLIPSVKLLGTYVNNLNYLFAYLGKGNPLPGDPVPREAYATLGQIANFRDSVERFIRAVNGDPEQSWEENRKKEELNRQAGFILSNTMKVISIFAVNFERIFNNPASDVSYIEMLKERRIHLELLPSLTKSRETTKLLGSLAVAGMKQAISANLPANIEGLSADVLESLPSASRQLFCMIEDEKGAIASEESELLYTQGRSFNICMKMGTQDIQGGEGRSEGERKVFHQILNNTYLMIGMRVDDPGATGEFLTKKGHKTYVNTIDGHEFDEEAISPGTYLKTGSSMREVEIVSSRDLARQSLGEAHAFCGGDTYRIKTPYMDLDLHEDANLVLNRHVLFKVPGKDFLYHHKTLYQTARDNLAKLDNITFLTDTGAPEHAFKYIYTRQHLLEKLASHPESDIILNNAMAQFIFVHYQTMMTHQVRSDANMVQADLAHHAPQRLANDVISTTSIESSLEDQGEEDFPEDEAPKEFELYNTPMELRAEHDRQQRAFIDKARADGDANATFDFADMDFSALVANQNNTSFLKDPMQAGLLSVLSSGGVAAKEILQNSDILNPGRNTPHDPDSPYYDRLTSSYRRQEFERILEVCGDTESQVIAVAQTQPPMPEDKATRREGRPPKAAPAEFAKRKFSRD